ncbi:MAG TPA: polya polymerase [Clostridiaceae bacterium]|nr:polya polymerase [Clostridiaceae bacterium]
MKLYNVDVEKFAEMIQGCKGKVVLITEDGDRLVTNSMLSALVGFAPFLKVAEAKEINIECEHPEDKERVINFMMNYSSPN